MAEKTLSITLALKDELTKKMNVANESIGRLRETTNQNTKGFTDWNKSVRNVVKPFSDLRTTLLRVGGVAAIAYTAFNTYKGAITETAQKVAELDKWSIKLGVTTEALSQKLYGKNIATNNPRAPGLGMEGGGRVFNAGWPRAAGTWMEGWGQDINAGLTRIKAQVSEITGAIVRAAKQADLASELKYAQETRLGRKLTSEEMGQVNTHAGKMANLRLAAEDRSNKGKTDGGLAAAAEVKSKIDQLTLSSLAFKRQKLNEEVALYRQAGVDETQIVKYQAEAERSVARDRSMELLKMHAAEQNAKGQTDVAMRLSDMANLAEFKKKYGGDGEMVQAFKAGQAAIRAAKVSEKNIELSRLQVQTLEVQGKTSEAFKIQQQIDLAQYRKTYGSDGQMMTAFRQFQVAQLSEFQRAHSQMNSLMQGIGSNMSSSLGSALADVTTGFSNMKDIAAEFGRSIISTIAQVIAKIILMKTLGAALSGFTGGVNIFGSYHQGGTVRRAHTGYLASDEVPIIAQAGEGIISRKGMARLGSSNLQRLNSGGGVAGGGGVTIHVNTAIKAWDTEDILRNQNQIVGLIGRSISSNGEIRKLIMEYAR